MRQPAVGPTSSAPNSRKRSRPAAAPSSPIGLISGMSNILMLTGAFFMLEVYDRVLPSRSVPTLVALVDPGRRRCSPPRACSTSSAARILVRIGAALDEALSGARLRHRSCGCR